MAGFQLASSADAVFPLALGFLAGITVLMGLLFMLAFRGRLSETKVAFLQAVAGGVLAYLAMETGHSAAEYVEELAKWETAGEFLIATVVTTAAMMVTLAVLSYVEQNISTLRGLRPSFLVATIIAVAFGVHNVGEGFAIAAALMGGYVAQAYLFAIGFAVHNFTEGFGIAGPVIADRGLKPRLSTLTLLSLLAGLPVVLGVAVYYAGVNSGLFISTLNTSATASIVYAMLHVNLSAMGRLGGVKSLRFWSAIVTGVAVAFLTESIILFSGVH
ncbi:MULTISPECIES: ZIP family metal transporter [Pyrobaculum]|uniref:Zinc transporter, ZIP family n=2 Tax=Pyrobaculum arsenaticum TaxID=121277 RepID=A4WK52_PYRAR|nr:ZIP family metal transporter [Pyrobaculum arsenaticum]ABP50769.1 zinc transporter, ZIP family [Pyrobaculum arsenaticum DSM 13514]MCY0891224.1 ZIP family metal transporter [Pyrobaculum arsenaticum]NYR15514.1 ZIP family metal transporter [Pyrobaculum arsenaticum]